MSETVPCATAPIERSRHPKTGVSVTESPNCSAARARLRRIQLRNVVFASVSDPGKGRMGHDLGEVPEVGLGVFEIASPVINKFEIGPVYLA